MYLKVSPFFVADKIKTPLLIVHGADDANPGTTPIQAGELYKAIRGTGGTTRLVMLPNEPPRENQGRRARHNALRPAPMCC